MKTHLKTLIGALCAGAFLASPSHAQTAKISDGIVKIGVMTDLSGIYSDLAGPGAVIAVKMAVEDFGGKVNGVPIEVVVADMVNKPDVASSIARKWLDQEKVCLLYTSPSPRD